MTPYFSSTAAGVIRARSETPLRGYSTVVVGVTSWRASRSPVQISTSMPAASARVVRVPMTSSASKPSFSKVVMPSAWTTSLMRSTWPLNSDGEALRLPLYSAYSAVRNVCRDTSKATATCVGRSSRSTLMSIDVKPNTALVCWPVVVEKFSTGRAKKAR